MVVKAGLLEDHSSSPAITAQLERHRCWVDSMTGFGLGVVIERIIYLQVTKSRNKQTWDTIFPMISKGQFKQARPLAVTVHKALHLSWLLGVTCLC